jgi:hypothetical protein
MAVDEQKLQDCLGRALVDLGGAVNAVLMSIGDELGLYKALAKEEISTAWEFVSQAPLRKLDGHSLSVWKM